MNKLHTIASFALLSVLLLSGCTATKIEYEQNDKGETKYSLWHNDHWLKTNAERMEGGMDKEGKLSWQLAGLSTSPSEEFNKTMQTYMGAIVSAMQIAAAAYNPSASSAIQSAASKDSAAAAPKASSATQSAATKDSAVASPKASSATQSAATSERAASAADCPGGSCTDKDCPGGSCAAPSCPAPVNICTGAPLSGTAKDCAGGSCTDKDCAGGACTDTNK